MPICKTHKTTQHTKFENCRRRQRAREDEAKKKKKKKRKVRRRQCERERERERERAHCFKNWTEGKTKFASGSRFLPIFPCFDWIFPVLGLFFRPNWSLVPGSTDQTGQSGPVFKTLRERTREKEDEKKKEKKQRASERGTREKGGKKKEIKKKRKKEE